MRRRSLPLRILAILILVTLVALPASGSNPSSGTWVCAAWAEFEGPLAYTGEVPFVQHYLTFTPDASGVAGTGTGLVGAEPPYYTPFEFTWWSRSGRSFGFQADKSVYAKWLEMALLMQTGGTPYTVTVTQSSARGTLDTAWNMMMLYVSFRATADDGMGGTPVALRGRLVLRGDGAW